MSERPRSDPIILQKPGCMSTIKCNGKVNIRDRFLSNYFKGNSWGWGSPLTSCRDSTTCDSLSICILRTLRAGILWMTHFKWAQVSNQSPVAIITM